MDIQSTHPDFDPAPIWERNKGGACFTSVSLPNVLTTDGPAKALRPRLGESRYEVHCTDLFPIATLKLGLKNGGYVQYQMETSRKGAVSLVFQGFGVRGGWDLSRTWHRQRICTWSRWMYGGLGLHLAFGIWDVKLVVVVSVGWFPLKHHQQPWPCHHGCLHRLNTGTSSPL